MPIRIAWKTPVKFRSARKTVTWHILQRVVTDTNDFSYNILLSSFSIENGSFSVKIHNHYVEGHELYTDNSWCFK